MSAISGMIDYQGIQMEKVERLKKGLDQYRFDKRSEICTKEVWMECGLQWFTQESIEEQLPFEDHDQILSADVILDNREELIKELPHCSKAATDSQLILSAYKKWGKQCVHHLLGDYAFAIWDKEKESLFCVRDHVGKRSLYYWKENDCFIFATVMKPILIDLGKEEKLNEKWLTDFLTLSGPVASICIDETPYEGIHELPPGHYLNFSKAGIEVIQYWHPERIKTLKLSSDAAYEETFNRVFEQAVRCRLRSRDEIGIMLSSGLDSTAVAAIAAPLLANEGRVLHSFTEVPMTSYKNYLPKSQIINEQSYVVEMQKLYPNINTHFNSYSGENAFIHIPEDIQILEAPHKIVENFYWMKSLFNEARENKCIILLDGQFGNFTISQGNVFTYWNTLFKKNKWYQLTKEVKAFGKFNHLGRRVIYKVLSKKLRTAIKANHNVKKKKYQIDQYSVVNPKLASKWKSLERIGDKGYAFPEGKLLDEEEQKQFVTNLILFSHLGSIETKCSLELGILRRDPTRDKRVIEFCLGVPISQYVHKGRERDLIRRAMKEKVPDCIRLNYRSRGKQAADWVQRVLPYWDQIQEQIKEYLKNTSITYYIDKEKIIKLLQEVEKKDEQDIYGFRLKALMIVLIFSRFLDTYHDNNYFI